MLLDTAEGGGKLAYLSMGLCRGAVSGCSHPEREAVVDISGTHCQYLSSDQCKALPSHGYEGVGSFTWLLMPATHTHSGLHLLPHSARVCSLVLI